MAVLKGMGGGQGGPPSLDNVDLSNAKTLECEECKCKGFKQTLMLKKLSALISPNGKESLIPVAVFACEKCNHVNQEFTKMELSQ